MPHQLSHRASHRSYGSGLVLSLMAIVTIGSLSLGVPQTAQAAPNPAITQAGKATYPPIQTQSNAADIALAEHLTAIGAVMYGAYWCPHCHTQQALFGRAAFAQVTYVECAEDGDNSQTPRCRAAGVPGFPTWQIDGELYPGVRSLNDLADLSGYTGSRDFRN